MRILIVTDAWAPQVNGVTRTLSRTSSELVELGHDVALLTPCDFRTVPCPGEPQIRLALATPGAVASRIDRIAPDAVHLATEGPLGVAAHAACRRRGLRFTTSICTRWPQYLARRFRLPAAITRAALRRFHGAAARTTVATVGLRDELRAEGFRNLVLWSRGVDTRLFRPRPRTDRWPRPVHLAVGRVAPEKNLEEFLRLSLPGTKVVVGDGPARAALQARHPDARFLGVLEGEELARAYADADLLVFPSRTDTFGLVILEALAAGVPVAAHPARGPLDILGGERGVGALHEDLARAIRDARDADPAACRALAERYSWTASARQLASCLVAARGAATTRGGPAPAGGARPGAAQRDPPVAALTPDSR